MHTVIENSFWPVSEEVKRNQFILLMDIKSKMPSAVYLTKMTTTVSLTFKIFILLHAKNLSQQTQGPKWKIS